MRGTDPTPSVRRPFTDEDREVEVISTLFNSVSFSRGAGDSGRKKQLVKFDCPHPHCSYDRAVRVWHVNPFDRDKFEYYCQNPRCPHYHEGRHTSRGTVPKAQKPQETLVECSHCSDLFDLTDYPEQEGVSPKCPQCADDPMAGCGYSEEEANQKV